jgi:hypothetical protein
VAVITIDDMSGHELVNQARDSLYAEKAGRETGHHDETGDLIRVVVVLEILFRLG